MAEATSCPTLRPYKDPFSAVTVPPTAAPQLPLHCYAAHVTVISLLSMLLLRHNCYFTAATGALTSPLLLNFHHCSAIATSLPPLLVHFSRCHFTHVTVTSLWSLLHSHQHCYNFSSVLKLHLHQYNFNSATVILLLFQSCHCYSHTNTATTSVLPLLYHYSNSATVI